MTETVSPEIKEGGPRYKILVIQANPGASPELKIAERMFGRAGEEPNIADYPHLEVTYLRAPKAKEKPDKLERELAADEGFKPEEFFPNNPEAYQGIIITGSPFAAYPRALRRENGEIQPYLTRWKRELIAYIRAAVDHKMPVLGICFGAQMLAEALGGETERMKKGEEEIKEVGLTIVWKVPGASGDPIMGRLPEAFVVAENHGDCISRLPEGAVLLAENEYGIQGIRVDDEKGSPIAWGFQFHPERPPEEALKRLEKDPEHSRLLKEKLRQQGLSEEEINQQISGLAVGYSPVVSQIFSAFLDFVRGRI